MNNVMEEQTEVWTLVLSGVGSLEHDLSGSWGRLWGPETGKHPSAEQTPHQLCSCWLRLGQLEAKALVVGGKLWRL